MSPSRPVRRRVSDFPEPRDKHKRIPGWSSYTNTPTPYFFSQWILSGWSTLEWLFNVVSIKHRRQRPEGSQSRVMIMRPKASMPATRVLRPSSYFRALRFNVLVGRGNLKWTVLRTTQNWLHANMNAATRSEHHTTAHLWIVL